VHLFCEYRESLVELSAHARPLRALSGEHERYLAARASDAANQTISRLATPQRVKAREQRVAIADADDGSMLE
jgi:hypothetical protein